MSSSIPNISFLIDENVRIELFRFLQTKGFDVKRVVPSSSDTDIAAISKKEQRVLITNDEDFVEYDKDKIYSFIWLRIPQNDKAVLLSSCMKLLGECRSYKGVIIILKPNSWESFPLGENGILEEKIKIPKS